MKVLRYLAYLVWLFIALAVVAFAMANRQEIFVSFDPVKVPPLFSVSAPAFLFFLGIFCVGCLVGAFLSWLSHSRYRTAARRARRELETLRRQIDQQEKDHRKALAEVSERGHSKQSDANLPQVLPPQTDT